MVLRGQLTGVDDHGGATLSRLQLFWRIVGAVVLAVVLARWSWLLFAPQAKVVAVVPEQGATPEAGRLFGQAVSAVAVPDSVAQPNMHLLGVFAPRSGQPGFAVFKLDEKRQLGVAVGDNVIPGTKLLEAHPEYVLLEHSGVQQRLNLEVKVAGVSGVIAVNNVVPVTR